MLIGYARVSTNDQETATQVAALKAAGCERIYREKASGGRWDRPELHRLLDQLREADVLVVWKLDRLSRSLRDVLTIMERLTEAKAGFRSLTEAIDTTTPAGRMMMQMVGHLLNSKGPCYGKERRRVWIPPVGKDASAGVDRNFPLNNRPRSEGWFPEGTKRPLMPHGYSESIRPPSVGSSRGRQPHPSRRPNLPNNVDGFMPNNSESDSLAVARASVVSRKQLDSGAGHRFLWPVGEGLRPAEFHEKPLQAQGIPQCLTGFFDPAFFGGAPTPLVGPSAFFWPVELIPGHYTS